MEILPLHSSLSPIKEGLGRLTQQMNHFKIASHWYKNYYYYYNKKYYYYYYFDAENG